MTDSIVKDVHIHPFKPWLKNGEYLLGLARLELKCGIFLAEMRIFTRALDPLVIYIKFPFRENDEGKTYNIYYPIDKKAKKDVVNSIKTEYLAMMRENDKKTKS